MWAGFALLAFVVLLGLAGITGFGAADSRDQRFTLRPCAGGCSDRLYEHPVAARRRFGRLSRR